MTPGNSYPKIPLQQLPPEIREQAFMPDVNVIREREKDQPYSLTLVAKRGTK